MYKLCIDSCSGFVKSIISHKRHPGEALGQPLIRYSVMIEKEGVFIIPEEARWAYLIRHAQDDDIKIKLDRAMELLENTYPELRGILPKNLYASSNLDGENVTGLINLFSRDIFKADAGRESDLLGRVL